MKKLQKEYNSYNSSKVMQQLAAASHGENYCGQTSSISFAEMVKSLHGCKLGLNSTLLDLERAVVNTTADYLQWLDRWCMQMQILKKNILNEFGESRGVKLIRRFNVYKKLADSSYLFRRSSYSCK